MQDNCPLHAPMQVCTRADLLETWISVVAPQDVGRRGTQGEAGELCLSLKHSRRCPVWPALDRTDTTEQQLSKYVHGQGVCVCVCVLCMSVGGELPQAITTNTHTHTRTHAHAHTNTTNNNHASQLRDAVNTTVNRQHHKTTLASHAYIQNANHHHMYSSSHAVHHYPIPQHGINHTFGKR